MKEVGWDAYLMYVYCTAAMQMQSQNFFTMSFCILENLKSKTAQSRTEQVSDAKIAVRFPQPPYQQMSSQLIAPTRQRNGLEEEDWIKANLIRLLHGHGIANHVQVFQQRPR